MNAGTAEFYDNMLPTMERYYDGKNGRLARINKSLSAIVRPGMRVLDVGCGVGFTAKHLIRLEAIVTAIDISPQLVEFAMKMVGHKNIAYIIGDICEFESKEKFDLIIFADSFEHIPFDRIEDVVRGLLRRNTHKESRVYINIPDGNFSLFMKDKYPEKQQVEDVAYSIGEILALFAVCGFEPIHLSIYGIDTEVQYNEYLFCNKDRLMKFYSKTFLSGN